MEVVQKLCSSAWYGGWSIGGLFPRSLRAIYLRFFGTVHEIPVAKELLKSKEHVVILAHGVAGFPELWTPLVDELKLLDAVVIAPQFTTGGADAMAKAAQKMGDLLQQIPKDTQVTWVGHSWGGILGAHLVTQESAHIDQLVLISTRCAVKNVRYNVWHGFLRDQGAFSSVKGIIEQIEDAKWPDGTKVLSVYDPYDWLVPEGGFAIGAKCKPKTFEGCGHLGTLFSSTAFVATWITENSQTAAP